MVAVRVANAEAAGMVGEAGLVKVKICTLAESRSPAGVGANPSLQVRRGVRWGVLVAGDKSAKVDVYVNVKQAAHRCAQMLCETAQPE